MLNLLDKGAFSFALRIFPNRIQAGLFSLKGKAVALKNIDYNPDDILSDIDQLLNELLTEAAIEKVQIFFWGGATFINETHNTLASYQQSLTFKQQLSDTLSLPVATESTTSACAAYQMLYGEAKQLHSFVCIHLSDVVEAAVVYDRNILLGKNGLTGAIGELFVTPETDDKTVELGRLNDLASLTSLKKALGLNMADHQTLAQYCFDNQKLLTAWFEQAAEPMRIAIHSLETLLNCQTIIIGGDVSSWFLDKFITQLRPYIPSIAQYGDLDVVRLIKTPQVEEVALKGAATLPLHAALSIENMQTLSLPSITSLQPVHRLIYLGR